MSGSRGRDKDRPSDSATGEEYLADIEPADFRLPSPQEELFENPNAEPLVRHLARDDSAGGRGTRQGEPHRTRRGEPHRSHHEHYSRSSHHPLHHNRRDRRYPEYRHSERRDTPRVNTAHAGTVEQERQRQYPEYRHRERRDTTRVDTTHTGNVQESSDPYMIRNVSSSAGESVASQRYWHHDSHSFESQQPPDRASHYSQRVPVQYRTPPSAQHFQRQPILATRAPYPSEEHHGQPRHPYPTHGSYFRPVDSAQRGEHAEAEAIEEINENDVICGRGGAANTHIGNRSFREFVKKHQPRYLKSKKKDKPAVAEFIVNYIKKLTPPGRFVKKDQHTGLWYEVSDERAREKASQALREGAAAKRRGEEKEGDTPRSSPTTKSDGSNDSEEEKEEEDGRVVLDASKLGKAEAIEDATEDKEEPASASSQAGAKGGSTADDEPHEPIDIEDHDSLCSASSDGSGLARANAKRVIIIRPALELRRQQLATVDVATLSEEEKAVYFDSFTPPAYSPSTVVSETIEQQL